MAVTTYYGILKLVDTVTNTTLYSSQVSNMSSTAKTTLYVFLVDGEKYCVGKTTTPGTYVSFPNGGYVEGFSETRDGPIIEGNYPISIQVLTASDNANAPTETYLYTKVLFRSAVNLKCNFEIVNGKYPVSAEASSVLVTERVNSFPAVISRYFYFDSSNPCTIQTKKHPNDGGYVSGETGTIASADPNFGGVVSITPNFFSITLEEEPRDVIELTFTAKVVTYLELKKLLLVNNTNVRKLNNEYIDEYVSNDKSTPVYNLPERQL